MILNAVRTTAAIKELRAADSFSLAPFSGPLRIISYAERLSGPVLSANFESSAPGLYFVGVMATNTFGPVMRFLTGARYTAEQLSRHLSAGGASHSRSRARWPAGYVRSRECAFYAL